MPTPTRRGYASNQEFIDFKKRLEGLKEAGTITEDQFQNLLQANKADVATILKPIAPVAVPEPTLPETQRPLQTPPKRTKFIPAEDVSFEIGKQAAERASKSPPSVKFEDVVTEEQQNIVEGISGPRTPGGKKATTIVPVVGQQKEPTGWKDVFSRQELVFPEDKKALEELPLIGQTLSTLLFREDPDSRIVESNLSYIGRMLGLPSEVIATGIETVISPETRSVEGVEKTLQGKIKKGGGLLDAGIRLGNAIEEAVGQPLPKLKLPLAVLSFIGDFYIPSTGEVLKPAVGLVRNVKSVRQIVKKFDEFSTTAADVFTGLVKNADSVAKDVVVRFSTDPLNIHDTTDFIRSPKDYGDVASKLGFGSTEGVVDTSIVNAGFADALSKAPTPEIKAEIIDAFEQMMANSRSPFNQDVIGNARKGLSAGTRTADDAQTAEELLAHSILKFTANKKLSQVDEFVSRVNPDVKVGSVVAPALEVKRAAEQLKELTAGVRVNEQVQRAVEAGKKPVIIIPPKFKADLETRNLPNLKFDEVVVTTPAGKSKQLVVPLDRWNNWVEQSVERLVAQSPEVRTTVREGKSVIGGAVEAVRKTAPVAKIEEKAQEVLAKIPALKRSQEIAKQAPEVRESLKEAQQQLSSVGQDFKRQVIAETKAGKSKQQAFADVIIENYGDAPGLQKVTEDGKVLFRDPKGINPDVSKEQLVGDLFDDFIATIYGADEKVVQASKSFFGKSFPGADPVGFRKGLEEIYENPGNVLTTAKREFAKLIEEGKNKEAVEFLFKLHRGLENRPLSFAGRTTKVDDAMEVAIPSSKTLDALSFSYLNRKSAEIVAQVARKPEFQGVLTNIEIASPLQFERLQEQIKEGLTAVTLPSVDPVTLRPLPGGQLGATTADADLFVNSLANNRDAYAKELRTYVTNEGSPRQQGAVDRLAQKVYDDAGVDNPVLLPKLKEVIAKDFEDRASQIIGASRIIEPTLVRPREAIKDVADAVLRGLKGEVPRVPRDFIQTLKKTKTGKLVMEELETSRNLAQAGKTIEDLRAIPKTYLGDLPEGKSAGEIIEAIKALPPESGLTPRMARLLATVTDGGSVIKAGGRGLRALENLIKAGMLAGSVLPNFAYHAQNILTAPLIINSTLGGKQALAATKDLLFLDPRVNRAVDELFGVSYGTGKASELLRGPKSGILTTPSGKTYSPKEIAELVAKNGVVMTEQKAELSQDLLRDFVKWSGKNLKGEDVGKARQFAREFDPTKPNVWFEMANYFDSRFRTGVLVRALEEGKTEQEALQMARDALFDYGKISDFERQTIGKVLWFWSFERSAITQAAKNLLTNPRRVLTEQRIKNMFREDGEIHSADSDYRQNNIFLGLIKDNKGSYNLYGPELPQANALARLTDYLGALFPMIGGEGLVKTAAERVGASSYVTGPLALMGKDFNRGEISDPTTYVDPRILGWVKANPQIESVFNSYVKLVPVPPEELTDQSMTFGGLGYKIDYDDKKSRENYNKILELAKTIGMERALRDYAPVVQGDRPQEFTPQTLEVDDGMLEFLRAIGVVKTSPERTGEEVRSSVREKIIKGME